MESLYKTHWKVIFRTILVSFSLREVISLSQADLRLFRYMGVSSSKKFDKEVIGLAKKINKLLKGLRHGQKKRFSH